MKQFSRVKLKPDERKAIHAFSRRLRKSLGKQVLSVLLFGSKARGSSRRDSDIDIYILVKNNTMRVHDRVGSITANILDEYDILISPVVYDQHEERRNLELRSFFFEAVKAEGIPL